jgi:hypothetical protein
MEASDFTAHELAYIEMFNHYKEKSKPYDVSVFRQAIVTREDLLNTIFFRNSGTSFYTLASILNFQTRPGLMARGKSKSFYFNNSYPFYSFPTEKEFSDLLCSSILNYLPQLKLPSIEPVIQTVAAKETFLHHYETSIDLLLRGPPHAGEYGFHEEKKEEWIAAQKTEERRRLARLLVDNTIYISHSRLLGKIQECVSKVQEKLTDGPITFIVGTKDKSNYYISLLFYHFWRQAGLPLDFVKSHMDDFVQGNLIDIDEMAYSGTQTTGTLAHVYGMLVLDFHKKLIALNKAKIESFAKTLNFLPVGLVETYFAMKGVNYIVLRVFCSENGFVELSRMPPANAGSKMRGKPPFYLVIGEILPSPKSLFGNTDAKKMSILFGHPLNTPAATVYFNHKIADLASTYLYALAYGVVPDKVLADPFNEGGVKEANRPKLRNYLQNLKINPGENAETTEFLPFINYCGQYERMMPKSRKDLLEYQPPGGVAGYSSHDPELPQEYRCPYAWYKGIDYETGTYTPPPLPNLPLPHGPTEDNFMGGKRTRKQKQSKKRKTRSKKH